MNYLNDANWLGRTPRTLQESKFGAHAEWDGYDNDARPTFADCCAIAFGFAVIVGFLFIGPIVYGAPQ